MFQSSNVQGSQNPRLSIVECLAEWSRQMVDFPYIGLGKNFVNEMKFG
jgi:hypothetical protein